MTVSSGPVLRPQALRSQGLPQPRVLQGLTTGGEGRRRPNSPLAEVCRPALLRPDERPDTEL